MLGVWIVIAAQIWTAVPIAGAIALCAWGTALVAPRRPHLATTLLVYGPLAALAIAAQLHAATAAAPAWRLTAAIDVAAAALLMIGLIRFTAEKFATPSV